MNEAWQCSSVQDISCIALSQDVNLLYCHCVATTDVRELRSVQMACYMYHIIMTTVGAHTRICIDMIPCAYLYV